MGGTRKMEHHSGILAISVTIKSVTNSHMVLVFCCYLWPVCNLLIGFLRDRRAGLKTLSNAFFSKQKGSQTNRYFSTISSLLYLYFSKFTELCSHYNPIIPIISKRSLVPICSPPFHLQSHNKKVS